MLRRDARAEIVDRDSSTPFSTPSRTRPRDRDPPSGLAYLIAFSIRFWITWTSSS